MFDPDTFLTVLYVTIDDFCLKHLAPEPRPSRGCSAALSRSEVLTLSLFGQFARFQSERDFYRFAQQKLRPLFPTLPHRSQFNRLQQTYQRLLTQLAWHLSHLLGATHACYQVLDRTGIATRWCGRRGMGWLPAFTDKGYCNRLGYFEGFALLLSVTDTGIITGFAVGAASAKDQPLADAFLKGRYSQEIPPTVRHHLLPFVGAMSGNRCYVLDKGFTGRKLHRKWHEQFDLQVVCCPQRSPKQRKAGIHPWPKEWRVWLAARRQIIESVHERLLNLFRLHKERPHNMVGFFARLSAKVALYNFCLWLNQQAKRPLMQLADLLDW
jgi:hypothetical protein